VPATTHRSIADDLHDVIAHALSAMTVQATGAARLALTRPDHAATAFEAIEAAGREALGELRRLLRLGGAAADALVGRSIAVMIVQAGGARRILEREPRRAFDAAVQIEQAGRAALTQLRHLLEHGHAPLAPQPTLAELGELVVRRLATLEVRGVPRPLPAGLALAAYRIVEEALPGPGGVVVSWGPELVLEISPADVEPPGARDRAWLYGGTFEGGAERVRAVLPIELQELAPV